MSKINLHIEVVRSTEPGLSSMSQPSCDAIIATLSKRYAIVGVSVVNNLLDLEALVASEPDLVFLGMKFIPVHPSLGARDSERIWISDYLDTHHIAYTGSSRLAHEFELNKPLAKQKVLAAGLKTPRSRVARQYGPPIADDASLRFPLFVKPADRGGGFGIDSDSVVHNLTELNSKIYSINTELRSDAIIEEYLPGREFSVAILKNEYSPGFFVMPLELIAPVDKNGSRLLSQQVKKTDAEQAIEITDAEVKAEVMELAISAYHALGAQDYGRIDIRMDKSGVPNFLEANLIPSLISGYGSFPKACVLNLNLDYESMILSIVRLGLERNLGNEVLATDSTDVMLTALEPAFEPI